MLEEAESVLEGLDCLGDCKTPWDLLVKRFEDKPGMIQKHEFIDLPKIHRKFIDHINRYSCCAENWDNLVILLITRKMGDHS